jgi:hypothetical protein
VDTFFLTLEELCIYKLGYHFLCTESVVGIFFIQLHLLILLQNVHGELFIIFRLMDTLRNTVISVPIYGAAKVYLKDIFTFILSSIR